MSTQMDKLLAAQEKAQKKMQKAQSEEKQIKKQINDLARKERTHRLCERGGHLEKLLLEPELLDDKEVFSFLDAAFRTPYVKNALNDLLEKKRKESAGTQAAEAGSTAENEV